jgi:integrase
VRSRLSEFNIEADAEGSRPENREQCVGGVEQAVEDRSRLERDRPDAVFDSVAADFTIIASFHDFDEYERLVGAAEREPQAQIVVLLGGEAGLRCGEMMPLEWTDVDLTKRQLRIERSDWNGHVTTTKGGRLRYVPLTERLTAVLKAHRHLKGARVLCDDDETH